MSKTAILGYWGPRGLCERVRIFFEHVGFKYGNRTFTNDGPLAWLPVKPTLGLDFSNLPYLIDGDFKISESMAIMKYVGRKKGCLIPDSVEDWAKADMMECIITDIFRSFVQLCYSPNYDDLKSEFLKKLQVDIEKFDKHLAKNKWLIGDQLTYIDFCLGEMLDQFRLWNPVIPGPYTNVKRYLNDYDNLESVSNHRKASTYKPLPMFGEYAYWGGINN